MRFLSGTHLDPVDDEHVLLLIDDHLVSSIDPTGSPIRRTTAAHQRRSSPIYERLLRPVNVITDDQHTTHPTGNMSHGTHAWSLSRYPSELAGLHTTSCPGWPYPRSSPSGSTTLARTPGRRRPALPGVPMCMSSCGKVTVVHVSVIPITTDRLISHLGGWVRGGGAP